MSDQPRVVLLGAGPAGVGGAWKLRQLQRARVTVLEQKETPGGIAGSFEFGEMRVDFGSHRLHPATDPAIMADIQSLLGPDLRRRPRHGRIRLRGRWIHFPLKPQDLLLRLDPGFALGTLRDMVAKPFRAGPAGDSFADVLHHNLGPTICDSFYFPYARKIWGRDPGELSGIQARRRVSAGSFGKLIRKVLSALPGLRPPGAGTFFYPVGGYGRISEAYADAAVGLGADLRFGRRVTRLVPPDDDGATWLVEAEHHGETEVHEADQVWSTLPITILARLLDGNVPDEVREAAASLEYRSMLLVYLALPVQQFTEYDAHYFPEASVRITRLQEPKNYPGVQEPLGRTVLCAELPAARTDPAWTMDDAALGQLVADDLATAGIPLPAPAVAVHVERLPQAYPIYREGYEQHFEVLDAWAESMPRLLSYGRQGLFAHDNTHHALAMAYAAAECLGPSGFNHERWAAYRAEFEKHVVED
jgi:protoporphyrinogen oxidase